MPAGTDRASHDDLAFLAIDNSTFPEQFAAVLLLDHVPRGGPERLVRLLAERIPNVPRLRQRLLRTPPGAGRPIWTDDPRFDLRRHVRHQNCPPPADEPALLELAVSAVTTPLPRDRPLWSALLVTGLADGTAALVIVLHHALADGIGGLTVLANLLREPAADALDIFPRPRPSAWLLVREAAVSRLRGLPHTGRTWRRLRSSLAAGGGLRPAPVTDCSLLRRTGPRRAVRVVRADLAAVRDAAHRGGGTVNDAVLAVVTGALRRVLAARGETVDEMAVAVPVAGRRSGPAEIGNQIAPLLVRAPVTGALAQRIPAIAATTRATKATASQPPPTALLGPVFRAAAALGGYRWFMRRQRRMHTLVSNVRGPDRLLTLAGATITGMVPVATGESGNVTVSFDVLSYAGTLVITAITDPDTFADLPALVDALRTEISLLGADPPAGRGGDHIWSGAAIPSRSRPWASTRAVRSQSTSRLARTSSSARSTGQCS